MQLGFVVRSTLVDVLCHSAPREKVEAHRVLAGDLGRRTGRSESYPRSSLGVPRQVLTHGAVKLTFRGGQFFGVGPLLLNFEVTMSMRQ